MISRRGVSEKGCEMALAIRERDLQRNLLDALPELAHARGAHGDLCTASHIGCIVRVKELLGQDPSLVKQRSDYLTY